MAWRIELDRVAGRELDKLEPKIARRILKFIQDRMATRDDPRSIGEPLKGDQLSSFRKYRIGDDRVIVGIEDGDRRIIIVRIGNRKDIYR